MALFANSSSPSSAFPSPIGRPFTIADVSAMPRELPSGPVDYELDNGALVTMSPTGRVHGVLQGRLAAALISTGDQHGHGQTMVEAGVVLWRKPDRLVGPDVAFFSKKSFPLKESPEGYLETIPDLVFEVRSKNDTAAEMQHKVADYLAAGVAHVFVVDPNEKQIFLHRIDTSVAILGEQDVLRLDEIIPGFALSLAELFRP